MEDVERVWSIAVPVYSAERFLNWRCVPKMCLLSVCGGLSCRRSLLPTASPSLPRPPADRSPFIVTALSLYFIGFDKLRTAVRGGRYGCKSAVLRRLFCSWLVQRNASALHHHIAAEQRHTNHSWLLVLLSTLRHGSVTKYTVLYTTYNALVPTRK